MDPKTAQYLSSSFGNKGLCMGWGNQERNRLE